MKKKHPKPASEDITYEDLEDLRTIEDVFYFGDDIEEIHYDEDISYESAMEP